MVGCTRENRRFVSCIEAAQHARVRDRVDERALEVGVVWKQVCLALAAQDPIDSEEDLAGHRSVAVLAPE
jgi:hypothetical protein